MATIHPTAIVEPGAELGENVHIDAYSIVRANVRIGEGTLADYLNRLLESFPLLQVGSYPEFSNPEYQVKVTLESRDGGYLEQALGDFLARLPADAVVKVS